MNSTSSVIFDSVDLIGLINTGFLLLASIVALSLAVYISFLLIVKGLAWVNFSFSDSDFRESSVYSFARRIDYFNFLYDEDQRNAAQFIQYQARQEFDLEGRDFDDVFLLRGIKYSDGALDEFIDSQEEKGIFTSHDEDFEQVLDHYEDLDDEDLDDEDSDDDEDLDDEDSDDDED